MKLTIGNKYKWKYEPQILVYIGMKNGWCECDDRDLDFMEEVE